jgi:hypothetical protein
MFSKKEFKMSEFTSWEDMSDLEKAQCTFWDMYKDAYGFRPRHVDTGSWTLEQFDKEFADLDKVMTVNAAAEKIAEAKAVTAFERRVAEMISIGARDYAMALRWIHEAEDTNGDDSYLAWTLGLPYMYFHKAVTQEGV